MATRDVEICGRLEQLRIETFGERGKSQMARELGIRPSTYDRYERDRVPPADLLAKVSDVADVTLEWLITGDGPKQAETVADIEAEALTRQFKEILVTRPDVRPMVAAFLAWIEQQPSTLPQRGFAGQKNWRTIPIIGSTGIQLPADVRRALCGEFDSSSEMFAASGVSQEQGRIESASLTALDSGERFPEKVRVFRFDEADQFDPDGRCHGSIQTGELPLAWGEHLVGIEIADDSMAPEIPIGCHAIAAIGTRPDVGDVAIALARDTDGLIVGRYHVEEGDVLFVPSDPRVDVTRVGASDVELLCRVVGVVTQR